MPADMISAAQPVISTAVGLLLNVILIGGIGFLVYHFGFKKWFGWPVDVTIFEKRGSNMYVMKDRGKRTMNDRGEIVYKLKNRKMDTKPGKFEHTYIGRKGKHFLYLFSPSIDEFDPILIGEKDTSGIEIIDEDMRQWLSQRYRQAYEKWQKKGKWEQYGSVIMMIGVAIGTMLVLYVTWNGIADVTAQFHGISNSLASVAEDISQTANLLRSAAGSTAVTTVPPF